MLQSLQISGDYAQPLSPMTADGDAYALPSDFVDGLSFLRPFVKPKRPDIERYVYAHRGQQCVLTNNLIVTFDFDVTDLPEIDLSSSQIRTLAAYSTYPTQFRFDDEHMHFTWPDGQRLRLRLQHVWRSRVASKSVVDALDRFWNFDNAMPIDDEMRQLVRKGHSGAKPTDDLFINGEVIHTHLSDKGGKLTSEHATPFKANTGRVILFDRSAFLDMIKVADAVDFSTSPVCFRHANGRGLLVERTPSSYIPDFEAFE